MPKNRKKIIAKLIKEGFTHRTLSSFSDNQIKVLSNKLLGEGIPEEISNAEKQLADLKLAQSEKLANDAEELKNPKTEEVVEDDEPIAPDVKAMNSSGEELDLLNDISDDSIYEQKELENWVMELVKENQQAEITKENFIKTVRGLRKPKINVNKQQKSYNMVNELANEMGLRVVVEEIKGSIKGYLKSKKDLIEVNITKEGDVTLDGKLVEDDIESNQPMPTIAPPTTKQGEKERRGPFKKPKTTPKPKAKKKSPLPDWLEFTNLGKSLSR